MKNELSAPIFWTWDHSTNWVKNQTGKQTAGSNNMYSKPAELFKEDYCRAILWAEQNGVAAVGLAGLLRDFHNGLDDARYIADFAKEHNVILYPIVGLYAYGGVYYEGETHWSLNNFLRDNPECFAVDDEGKPRIASWPYMPKKVYHGCFSNQKMLDHVLRSLEWLFKEIPSLGGISMETSDTGVCQCEACRSKRTMPADTLSYDDMAIYYPKAIEAVRSIKPDAMIICETYSHFLPKNMKTPAWFGNGIPEEAAQLLSAIPKDAYISWVADKMMKFDDWKEDDVAPAILKGHKQIMRGHYGTYWEGSSRHRLEIWKIRKMCRLSAYSDIDRISLFGEGASFNVNDELNYLAGVYFSKKPMASIEDFQKEVAAELLGSYEAAGMYFRMNEELNNKNLDTNYMEAIGDYIASSAGEVRRRWIWFGSYYSSFRWDKEHNITR